MMKYFAFAIALYGFTACTEAPKEKEKNEPQKAEEPALEEREQAVFVNDQLSLAQAHAFVLTDSLLRIGDLDSMASFISEVQLEIVAVHHRVDEIESGLEYAEEFKQAVLQQLDYIENGLKNEIPKMISISKSGKKELADQMYFDWIKGYQERSQEILAAQIKFTEKHRVKIDPVGE
ncbi:MAG: hypothetical protein R2799_06090 [Crocinitomicaceae bacterium]